jgi:hypothetical protein
LTGIAGYRIVTSSGGSPEGEGKLGAAVSPAASAIPAANACTVAPRALDEITRLVTYATEGVPEDAIFNTPTVTANPNLSASPPAGEPYDGPAVADIQAVYHALVACLNNQDFLRAYALFTDDGVARKLAPNGIVDVWAVAQLSVSPVPGAQQRTPGPFKRIERLDDDRLVAFLAGAENPENYLVFKRNGTTWLIDEWFETHG